jgi:hypothetical protein
VGDRERVTWRDFYQQLAVGLGRDLSRVHRLDPPPFEPGFSDRLNGLRVSKPVQALLPHVPSTLKQAVKGAIKGVSAPPRPSPWALPVKPGPQVTEEISALHQCSVQLTSAKAETILGYQPTVSFAEGMRRSLGWLRFAGYPVQQ